MRHLICVAALLWTSLALAQPPQRVVLKVQNLTCGACSITIERALSKVPGVSSTRVDSKAATVTVTFDAKRTDVRAVARALTQAGFPAEAGLAGG